MVLAWSVERLGRSLTGLLAPDMWARRHCPIPFKPRKAGCEIGPLMTGARAGAASGAGIRFAKSGARGTGTPIPRRLPKRTPWPMPPRAKLGVAAATQVTANTTARKRRMIAFLLLFCLPPCARYNHFNRL
jgi:hypothetical protein